jgi:S1-C subfamily serine protease
MRIFTDVVRISFLSLLYTAIVGCTGACSSSPNRLKPARHNFPVSSFVQIQSETLWEGCELNKETETGKPQCQKAVMRAVSSGAFIWHSDIDISVSYVLTAGHSCKSTKKPDTVIGDVLVKHLGQRFVLIDYNGHKHEAIVSDIDTRFDMCLLIVSNVYTKAPIIRLAKEQPIRGEIVYNMAAPHGIVYPRMVLTFDGYFAGYTPEGFAMYTIPTKPGSSGSPIININNELVGIIFAGYRIMENIGVASPLMALKVFLKNSIAKAEMNRWQKMNKGVDKTKTTTSTIMKNIHSSLHKYFHLPAVNIPRNKTVIK